MHWVFSVLILMLYTTSCIGSGFCLLRVLDRYGKLDLHEFDSEVVIVGSFLVGMSIYTALLTVIGVLGYLHPWMIILMIIPGILCLFLVRNISAAVYNAISKLFCSI